MVSSDAFTSHPPDKIQEVLKLTNSDHFPQLHLLLHLVSTFPVTSCETERSVSKLKHLKNYLRSSMGQERMGILALTFTHITTWILAWKKYCPDS